MELVSWTDGPPRLRDGTLLVALDGFIDAGAAGATAATFLRHRWRSEVVGSFDGDALIDYRARRPTVVIDGGDLRRVEWPTIELLLGAIDDDRDALLLLGPEPDMRWEAFGRQVVAVCRATGVQRVISVGAYPAAAPHTRPVRIMRARNSVPSNLAPDAVPVPGYTGPIGAATALQAALAVADIPAVGLWAEVPHYIAGSPNPGSALALVRHVALVLGVDVDTTELEAAATLHLEQVADAIKEYPEAKAMIDALERHVDLGDDEGDLPSGDDIAAEIEKFLRTEPE